MYLHEIPNEAIIPYFAVLLEINSLTEYRFFFSLDT